ncbi:SusC/RagA family TonB-linked outer membrane protein [Pedobacter rhizosphaerae]|uniref:TonB-linked outer membrane protein, SusC/RagA family n=1 Tax=Pedobacter rhizosphaerae TaxID=390241 RepID=A0A1H9LH60_9SPHI|nr:SusC/RagA family TonB-linked outer membrane protein [Pedobacter rhizosphaerae]SER10557.1 TonB-linked outer membrane protein, SusC/RagA family [Pedobacter rhizosphaerae]
MNKSYPYYLLLPVVFLLFTHLQGFAQIKSPEKTRVVLRIKEKSLAEVLSDIEKQSGYSFNYDQNEINSNQKVNTNSNSNLKAVLDGLSNELGLEFAISGRFISVRKAPKKKALPARTITGVVKDSDSGIPIPGVNIVLKGSGKGATTNADGAFIYKINAENIDKTVLVFSYVGMKPKEVVVGKQVFINVNLENDALAMGEVVVTGSYTREKRREEVVGSIAQVSAERLQTQRPIESFDKMLEGLVAGVQVETTTELNTPVKINIRGQGSLPNLSSSARTTSSQPLFVVDGLPLYEQQRGNESSVFNTEKYLNPLSNINPADIKTITILKDATASALYGANAANGVIIITTKSGTAGNTRFNFNYDTGVASFINQYKWLSGPQYYSLLREAYINDGRSATEATQLAGSKTNNVDWFDLTNRNATYHNFDFQADGGSEKTTFLFSSGYRNQQASSYGNDLQKIYFRLRADHQASDKLKIGFSANATYTKQNSLSNYGAVTLPPNIAPYNADGTFAKFLGVPNPLAVLEQNDDYSKGLDFQAIGYAGYQLTKEISIDGRLGANSYQTKQTTFESALNASGENVNGRLRIYDRNRIGYIGFIKASYDKTFAKKHKIGFLVGTELQNEDISLLRGMGSGFTFDRRRVLDGAAAQSSASSNSSNATVSYYSQLEYNYDKKYYLNFNGRADKSSIFGGDKQVALNGSAGASWIISNEPFLKDNKTITSLKIRTTFGSTGNSRIGNYSARGLYNFGTGTGSTYAGNVASYPLLTGAPNPDLGWEKNLQLNFGLDFSLFDRIQVTAEYYSNTINDLISSVDVPLETGFATISANTSKMRNSGFELSINANVIKSDNFSWNLAYNFGSNKNTLLAYNNGAAALYGFRDNAYAFKVGNSSSAIYGYQWAGVNPDTGAEMFYGPDGSIKTAAEINALPINNVQVIGERLPDFQGGLFNNFSYKNFELSFNVLYSYGASQIFSPADEADGRNLQNRNQSVNLVDRWQKPGDITDIPRLNINRTIVSNSSRYVYDVSYLKLSNVNLAYKLSDKLSQKLHLKRLMVFANATNLFYLYNDAGTKGRNGIAEKRFVYPESMALTAGVKVTL